MRDSFWVEVLHPMNDLLDDVGSVLFGRFEFVHKDASLSILHEEKDVILVVKVGIEFDNVRVIEWVVNSELVSKLFYHIIFFDSRFKYFF